MGQATALIADQQVRNRGTIGGSLAHGDPASDLPTVFLACEGSLTVVGAGGTREVAAADLFQDYLTTAVGEGEIVTEVRVPSFDGWGSSYQKFTRRAEDWAMVGVCAMVKKAGDGSVEDVRIALTNMGSTPLRATAVGGRPARQGPRRHRRGRRAGRRGHRPAGRPQRHAGLQAPPGARAHPPGAGRGGGLTRHPALTSPDAVGEALAKERYLADRALATAVFLAAELDQPLLVEGEAGVGKTEVAKALAAATGARLIRLQCHEGIDVQHALYDWDYSRQLHGGARGRGRRRRGRAVLAALPAAPPAAGGARGRRPGRAADRRDRPRRRRVRGLPARAAVRLPGHDPRAGDDRGHASARWWC